jgi:hypothetical protein
MLKELKFTVVGIIWGRGVIPNSFLPDRKKVSLSSWFVFKNDETAVPNTLNKGKITV